ncbi:hypothetical protein BDW67DRAFT_188973 [Aspergillus spinulosporus]
MRCSIYLLFAVLANLATPTIADTQYPACVETCITENPTSSWCDGTETGQGLDQCTCDSLAGSLMVECIQECSPSDQQDYAAGIPSLCRDKLFPASTTSTPRSGSAAETSSSTSSTETSSESTTTSIDSASPTSTDGAAVGTNAPKLAAVGGLLAALFV